MGLGLFGGGAGVVRFLVEQGAKVTVTDLRPASELKKGLELIEGLPVRLVLEEHRQEDFAKTDMVVANPAVPPSSPYLKTAVENNVSIESEMNLTLKLLGSSRVLGVTGSNGKTTTSHLIFNMLRAAGERAWLGGNMGGSLLPDIDKIEERDVVVLELSSFQLEMTGRCGLGPDVAVITNLTPNHLDRHGDFESYIEAKSRILVRARGAVFNGGDEASAKRFKGSDLPALWFSSRGELPEGYFLSDGSIVERIGGSSRVLVDTEKVRLPGVFNLENIMSALAGVRMILDSGPVSKAVVEAGAAFQGVSHRLETVASKSGITYINDSIATTPVSCLAALEVMDGAVHLIAGGYDKKLPLDKLAEGIIKRAESVHLIGETGLSLAKAVSDACSRQGVEGPHIALAGDLMGAVKNASQCARPGSFVLLSPAFASYDQFLNFEERGECFKSCVDDL